MDNARHQCHRIPGGTHHALSIAGEEHRGHRTVGVSLNKRRGTGGHRTPRILRRQATGAHLLRHAAPRHRHARCRGGVDQDGGRQHRLHAATRQVAGPQLHRRGTHTLFLRGGRMDRTRPPGHVRPRLPGHDGTLPVAAEHSHSHTERQGAV